jgi:hypothetical protein
MMAHSTWRDAIYAGVIGATCVALWFLLLDVTTAEAFATPAALGAALLGILGPPRGEGMATYVVAYTVFHYVAFILVAWIAALILHAAERQPAVLAGALMLFVAFELGFIVLSSVLSRYTGFQAMQPWAVAAGNLIAAAAMGLYLWKAHPQLRGNFDSALSGRDDRAGDGVRA